jgi:uncharacterized membrane protein
VRDLEKKNKCTKAWHKANKEKRKVYEKAYREANKEKEKAYREAHKDNKKGYNKAYREVNKKNSKAYKEANKERIKEYAKKACENLTDYYVINRLCQKTSLNRLAIPQELIELKRQQLFISRATKEISHELKKCKERNSHS